MMKKHRVPSDLVLAIVKHLEADQRFTSNIPTIHRALYKVSQDEELAPYFKDFFFDTAQMYPRSEAVTYAIDRMNDASFLTCGNPSLKAYSVTDKFKSSKKFDGVISDNGTEEKRLLMKAVDIFYSIARVS